MSRSQIRLTYRDRPIDLFKGGYRFTVPVGDIAIDADGAPDAYGPACFVGDAEGCGTDSLVSAGFPTNENDPIPDDWHNVLVTDPQNSKEPFLKEDGFFISKTSLCNEDATDDLSPGKYIDANQIAYIVIPQSWIDHLGVQLGDLCLMWHARIRKKVVAVVGDICPVDEPLGEISIGAAVALGGKNVSPRTGVDLPANGDLHCVLLKHSRPNFSWPITNDYLQSFRKQLEAMLDAAS